MNFIRNIFHHFNKILPMVISPILFFSFAFSEDVISRGVEKRIPQGANRILLRQTQVPPADVYADAINHLKRKNFEITASEETFDENFLASITESRPLVFTAKKQIKDTLAIRIMANVEQCEGPICGRLTASVDYAKDVDASIPEWKHALWSELPAKNAFFKALEILRGTSYDFMNFEVGVAVTGEKK